MVVVLTARFLLRTLTLGVLISVLATLALVLVLPKATGTTALNVLTGSMTPGLPVGSLVYVRPVDTEQLRVGDVATYQRAEGVQSFVTHRIAEIDRSSNPTSFIFKGDANRGPDVKPVPATAIRGEVWFHVPYLGTVRDALNGKAGLTLLAVLVLGGYAISQTAGALADRRRRRRRTTEGQRGLLCDRPVVVVVLDTNRWPGPLPCDESAVVLARDENTITWLIAPADNGIDGVRARLDELEPISMQVLEAPGASLDLVYAGAETGRVKVAGRPKDRQHAHA